LQYTIAAPNVHYSLTSCEKLSVTLPVNMQLITSDKILNISHTETRAIVIRNRYIDRKPMKINLNIHKTWCKITTAWADNGKGKTEKARLMKHG